MYGSSADSVFVMEIKKKLCFGVDETMLTYGIKKLSKIQNLIILLKYKTSHLHVWVPDDFFAKSFFITTTLTQYSEYSVSTKKNEVQFMFLFLCSFCRHTHTHTHPHPIGRQIVWFFACHTGCARKGVENESGRVRWASPFFQTSFMLSWLPGGKTLAQYLHAGLYVYGLGKKSRGKLWNWWWWLSMMFRCLFWWALR